jgi:hypothetical protein
MQLCTSESPGVLAHAQGALIPILGNRASQLLARTCRECLAAVEEIPQQFDNTSICVKKPSCLSLDKYSWTPSETLLSVSDFVVLKNSDLIIMNTCPWYQCLDATTKTLGPLRGILEFSFSAPCHIKGYCLNALRTHFFVVGSGEVKKYKITKTIEGRILQKLPTILPDYDELINVQVCEISPDKLLVLESTLLYTLDSKGIVSTNVFSDMGIVIRDMEILHCISSNVNGNLALCYCTSLKVIDTLLNKSRIINHSLHSPIQVQLSACGKIVHVLDNQGKIQTFWSYTKTSLRECNAKRIFLSGKSLFYVTYENSVHVLS